MLITPAGTLIVSGLVLGGLGGGDRRAQARAGVRVGVAGAAVTGAGRRPRCPPGLAPPAASAASPARERRARASHADPNRKSVPRTTSEWSGRQLSGAVWRSRRLPVRTRTVFLRTLVAHGDDALLHAGERARAGVLRRATWCRGRSPRCTGRWCGTCPCRRPTACATWASWPPRGARASSARRELLGELEVDRCRARLGDQEDAAVEHGLLRRLALAGLGRELDAAVLGVDRRAERDALRSRRARRTRCCPGAGRGSCR